MDSLDFFVDNLGPAIVRRLTTSDGSPFDITAGQTFRLRARSRYATTVLIDKLMVADTVNETVTYQPVAGDAVFNAEGTYRAWVHFVNALQDSEEFEIKVYKHALGQGTEVGAVWRACRALEPVAWDSLRSYPDYGDTELQRVIELAKLRVLPSAVPVADEASLDPRVVDYIAKKVLAENVLYAAISFWTNQTVQQTARGNSEEVVTYPDRIRTAEAAMLRYRNDLILQAGEISGLLDTVSITQAPAIDDQGTMLTPGLDEYQALPIPRRWGPGIRT
jgi:hypothetical protein